MKNNNMPALLGALTLLVGAPASAALYRCGNVFQDRPCDAQVQEVQQQGGNAGPRPAAAPRRAASAASAEGSAQPAHEPASAPAGYEAAAARPAASAIAAASAPARKGPPSLACGNLREQHSAIEARLRAGGRPETVEMYRRQQREVEKILFEGNCP
jgi:hypothetical protein